MGHPVIPSQATQGIMKSLALVLGRNKVVHIETVLRNKVLHTDTVLRNKVLHTDTVLSVNFI